MPRWSWVLALSMLVGCGHESGSKDATGGGAGSTCNLGTAFPDRDVIDPDAPIYQDANWTQEQVSASFADAKATNSVAYRAYIAARKYEPHMTCPFCACGCAEESGHRSALDCFKDMHGFT